MKWFVPLLKSIGAVDGAVAVVATSVAEVWPAHAMGCHAIVVACGTVGTVIAALAKFAPPPAVPS